MRVLFMNYISNGPAFNSGIAALSGYLKQFGHEVTLLNVTLQTKIKDIVEGIEQVKPQMVAFTIHTPHWYWISKHISFIKKQLDVFVVCGGYHPTLCPEEVINHPGVDCICRGEGEIPLLELVRRLESGENYHNIEGLWVKKRTLFGTKVKKNPICAPISLDNLPFADRDIFISSGINISDFSLTHVGGVPVQSGRGCPYNCYFCNNSTIIEMYSKLKYARNRYVRKMTVDRTLSELKFLVDRYEAERFEFWDEMFAADQKWLQEFCEKYKKEIHRPFICALRVERATKKVLDLLKDSGCQCIYMGVEVGNEEYRTKMLNRKMSNQAIEKAFAYAKEIGLERFAWVMLGLPEETPEMVEETIDFLRKIRPDMIGWSLFHPLPGTYLYKYCQKKGYLSDIMINPYKNAPGYKVPLLRQPSISEAELEKMIEKFRRLEHEGFAVNS